MLLRCPEVDGPPKRPPSAATAAGPSFSVPLDDPTLRWGRTRLMRCEKNSGHGDHPDRCPSSASPPSPSPPQTKNDPSPSSSRPRLVLRIPFRKKPERDGLSAAENQRGAPLEIARPAAAAENQRDHLPEDRKAAGGGAPLEIARPAASSVRRSLRSRVGAKAEEKTAKNEKRAGFHLSLSEEDIINDFIAMTGTRPPRRPKQRPRPLQKKLNEMFPGSDLPKIVTPALYRVSNSSR